MKIIFDNIIFSLQHAGGISVVWTHLINRMMKKWNDLSFIEYEGCDNIYRGCVNIPPEIIELRSYHLMKIKRYLNPHIKAKLPFIFHSSYFRICNHPLAINITTVHDFTYELFVNSPIKHWLHCRQKYNAIRHSDYVVCISENTKKDLFKFLPDIHPDKVKVIYNGVDETFHQLEDCTTQPYILYVGKRDPYKNFDKIIKPVSELGMSIHIVGDSLNRQEESLLHEHHCQCVHHGFVSNEKLNELYNHAFCLLYPSEYEGFGLPILEAQKAGCPVIAFNGSSIPEIIGDSTLLLHSVTDEEIKSKLQLLNNQVLRTEVIKKGIRNAERFSWDKMAEEYISLYKQIGIV